MEKLAPPAVAQAPNGHVLKIKILRASGSWGNRVGDDHWIWGHGIELFWWQSGVILSLSPSSLLPLSPLSPTPPSLSPPLLSFPSSLLPSFSGWCHAPVWNNSQTRRHRTILPRSTISNEEIMGRPWSAAMLQEIQWISTQRFCTIVSLAIESQRERGRSKERGEGGRERFTCSTVSVVLPCLAISHAED